MNGRYRRPPCSKDSRAIRGSGARLTLGKIVSGGQTGVDRGALDAALAAAFPCGGWCPEGRSAEDGPLAARYPLTELPGAGYLERTLQNVIDSDGTAILHAGALEGGTRQTLDCCTRHGRPCLVIDASTASATAAAERMGSFVARHGIAVLNVAGPRESQRPGIGAEARAFLQATLRLSSTPA